jgi:hypothetical protein
MGEKCGKAHFPKVSMDWECLVCSCYHEDYEFPGDWGVVCVKCGTAHTTQCRVGETNRYAWVTGVADSKLEEDYAQIPCQGGRSRGDEVA